MTTKVVSSDPPRNLVTTSIGRDRLNRVDVHRTYTPVAEGTRMEARSRWRMPVGAWLLRPVFRREVEANMVQTQARLRDYLGSVTGQSPSSAEQI